MPETFARKLRAGEEQFQITFRLLGDSLVSSKFKAQEGKKSTMEPGSIPMRTVSKYLRDLQMQNVSGSSPSAELFMHGEPEDASYSIQIRGVSRDTLAKIIDVKTALANSMKTDKPKGRQLVVGKYEQTDFSKLSASERRHYAFLHRKKIY